jgi:hypothetical protein
VPRLSSSFDCPTSSGRFVGGHFKKPKKNALRCKPLPAPGPGTFVGTARASKPSAFLFKSQVPPVAQVCGTGEHLHARANPWRARCGMAWLPGGPRAFINLPSNRQISQKGHRWVVATRPCSVMQHCCLFPHMLLPVYYRYPGHAARKMAMPQVVVISRLGNRRELIPEGWLWQRQVSTCHWRAVFLS